MDAPFKGKLTIASDFTIADQSGDVCFLYAKNRPGITDEQWKNRRDRVILCVNAYDGLVALVKQHRIALVMSKAVSERDGYDVLASGFDDDIREIDEALADPATKEADHAE